MPRTPRPAGAAPAIPATGMAGAVPPPDAPHEVSQPLQANAGGVEYADGTRMVPAERAAANERQLAPLLPPGSSPTQGVQPEGKLDSFYADMAGKGLHAPAGTEPAPVMVRSRVGRRPLPTIPVGHGADQPTAASLIGGPGGAAHAPMGGPGPIVLTDAPEIPSSPASVAPPPAVASGDATAVVPPSSDTEAGGVAHADRSHAAMPASQPVPQGGVAASAPVAPAGPAPLTDEDYARMPAASNSESPSRGTMRAALPPGKEITGGFGDGGLMYYALNGNEVLVLLDKLLGDLYHRCENDLRFNEALTYPNITARLVLEISGVVHDMDFTVEQRLIPPGEKQLPIEIAKRFGDEVCFVLVEECQEAEPDGTVVAPAGQIRAELGLQQPGRRRVPFGRGTQFVDVS